MKSPGNCDLILAQATPPIELQGTGVPVTGLGIVPGLCPIAGRFGH